MFLKTISSVVFAGLLISSPFAAAEEQHKVMIAPDLFSFEVMHDGELMEIKRNQNPESRITDLYARTAQGMPQLMHPFEPYDVETIAEREFVQYMIQAQSDKNIMIVDTRTIGWYERLTIPGAVSYPFTMMDVPQDRDWALDDFGVIKQSEGVYDFSKAKTLAVFCNGYWCGQTPSMVKAMLELGYPGEKIKYYRGGMQAWTSLGLTVVGDAATLE